MALRLCRLRDDIGLLPLDLVLSSAVDVDVDVADDTPAAPARCFAALFRARSAADIFFFFVVLLTVCFALTSSSGPLATLPHAEDGATEVGQDQEAEDREAPMIQRDHSTGTYSSGLNSHREVVAGLLQQQLLLQLQMLLQMLLQMQLQLLQLLQLLLLLLFPLR